MKPPAHSTGGGFIIRIDACTPKSASASKRLSVHGGAVTQAFDFVLEVQLATFEFQDGQIVDRGMLLGFGELALESLMPELKFRKMRL
jgi:hypothetical protein